MVLWATSKLRQWTIERNYHADVEYRLGHLILDEFVTPALRQLVDELNELAPETDPAQLTAQPNTTPSNPDHGAAAQLLADAHGEEVAKSGGIYPMLFLF